MKGEMWEMGEGWKETEQKREEEKEVRGCVRRSERSTGDRRSL